jgi:hypothetical protein
MLDSDSTHVRRTTERGGAVPIVRRITLGMAVALLIQYGLGMVVNLDVTVPARDQGGGVFVAIGRAFANGPAGLAIHAGLGLLLIIGAIQLVVRSVVARHRPLIWLSSVSLLAILGAALNGAAFVNSGNDGSSLGMAMLTGVALLCMTIGLYVLGGAPRPEGRGATGS